MNNQGWEKVMALNALLAEIIPQLGEVSGHCDGEGTAVGAATTSVRRKLCRSLGEQMAGTIVASTPSVSLLKQRSIC